MKFLTGKNVIPAMLPAVVLFVVFPVTYYMANAEELKSVFWAVSFFSFGLLISFALCLPLLSFKEKWSNLFSKILFSIGVYMLLADLIAPSPTGQLINGTELQNITAPLWVSIAQGCLFFSLITIACIVKWSEHRRNVASLVVLTVFVAQFAQLGFYVLNHSDIREAKGNSVKVATLDSSVEKANDPIKGVNVSDGEQHQSSSQSQGNIYHIVFDTYGAGFLEHAQEMGKLDLFEGFTFFENTLTNSDYTELSLPSFMSGTLVSSDPNQLKKWQGGWLNNIGIFAEMKNKGYTISEYQHNFWKGFKDADYHVTSECIDISEKVQNDSVSFIDHVLLRAAPNFLRKRIMRHGQGWTSYIVSLLDKDSNTCHRHPDQYKKLLYGHYARGPVSIALIRQLIQDEPRRPKTNQYVFAHVLFPHSPYNVDRDLEVRGIVTSWREQAMASVNLMVQFLDQLKKEGKYDSATIVFQGDHGVEFSEGENREGIPIELFKRVNTLLLIKPPYSKGKLVVSDYPAQLIDVAPTLYSISQISNKAAGEGVNLFEGSKPKDRNIHI